MSDMQDSLNRCELFADLRPESSERIRSHLKTVAFDAESVICKEGDIGDKMFIIVTGEAAILKDMGWGQREIRRQGVGEVIGEMALISGERRSATAISVTHTECLQLDSDGFVTLLDQDPHFAQRVAKVLTTRLSDLGQKSADEIVHAYRALMFALASLADSRDPETGAHLERTRAYCALLADLLTEHPDYREVVTSNFVERIYYVSPLHDIGKVAIPDYILRKPGPLTDKEYSIMKTHSGIGADALKDVLEQSNQEVFRMARTVCLSHHEKWDGTGYPHQISGEEIEIEARIMAIADVYDAMLSRRVYKDPMPYEAVVKEISESSGTAFDPAIVEVFISNIELFQRINEEHPDD